MRVLTTTAGALFLGISCAGSGASTTTAHSAPEAAAPSVADAQLLFDQNKLDETLIATDAILAVDPDNREARLLAARGNLSLAELGRSNTQSLLEDAARNYEYALRLEDDDPDTWVALADTRLKLGHFTTGAEAALKGAELLKQGQAGPDLIGAAVVKAAENEMQLFVEARRQEIETGEKDVNGFPRVEAGTMELAGTTLAHLEFAKASAPGPAYAMASQVHQWLGDNNKAIDELERGVRFAPKAPGIHQALQDLYFQLNQRRQCVSTYKRLTREVNDDPTLLWWLGRAQVILADEHRANGQWQPAAEVYREASANFEKYSARVPTDGSARHYLAICHLSAGRVAFEAGDLNTARLHYDEALAADPRVAVRDADGSPLIRDTFGGNYIGGLFLIGTTLAEQDGAIGLRKALEFFTEINNKHPRAVGQFYNNAGLAARDLGAAVVQAARNGTEEEKQAAQREAMELWERSYSDYCVAVELVPDDPRIINDCGLMLIYHLHREYDRARELFDQAIVVGTPQLEALTEDTPEDERNNVEEAVGDAYQNVAVLMARQDQPFDGMRPFLEKAVALYPYNRRQAAAMLRRGKGGQPVMGGRQGTQGGGSAVALAQFPQDSRSKAFAAEKKKADEKAGQNDFDGALLILDSVAEKMSGYAPFHLAMGLYSFRYATQSRDAGSSAGLVDGLYGDAVRNLEKAIALDGTPVGPRMLLAEVHFETGDFAAAAREADDLLSHLRTTGSSDTANEVKAHRLRGNSAARTYMAAKQTGSDDAAALRAARTSFRLLESKKELGETEASNWAFLEEFAHAQNGAAEAVAVLDRAVKDQPDSQRLLGQLVDTAARANDSAKAVEALRKSKGAIAVWFRARARYNRSEDLRTGGGFDEAIEELDLAIRDFDSSMAKNREFADSCEQWKALCMGRQAAIHLAQDNIAEAEKHIFAALRARPDRINDYVTSTDNLKLIVLKIADTFFRKGDLGNTERVYGIASDAVPTDADFANNHGLFARDHGVRLARDGDDKKAVEMFEKSYAAYTRASELDPSSVRLRNDRALILIHHLQREWEVALQALTTAIADGEKDLEENPAPAGNERNAQEEALGDCYENLALYHIRHTKNLNEAEKAAQRSREFHPGERRPGARRHLATIERLRGGDGR